MFRLATTSALALLSATAAHAGGYVVPIIEAVPTVAAPGASAPSAWWLAAIPLALLLFRDGGGDRATLPPGGHGGPCFREGTLVSTDTGWKLVETLKAGELVATTKGVQPILSVESWQPTERKDRAVIYEGVSLSQNHCVLHHGVRVPASEATEARGIIDGARFYHVLVNEHAWLAVTAHEDGHVVLAESLMLTEDIQPLAARFPGLAAHHAAWPCDRPVMAFVA